jgi:hypothetical protein
MESQGTRDGRWEGKGGYYANDGAAYIVTYEQVKFLPLLYKKSDPRSQAVLPAMSSYESGTSSHVKLWKLVLPAMLSYES